MVKGKFYRWSTGMPRDQRNLAKAQFLVDFVRAGGPKGLSKKDGISTATISLKLGQAMGSQGAPGVSFSGPNHDILVGRIKGRVHCLLKDLPEYSFEGFSKGIVRPFVQTELELTDAYAAAEAQTSPPPEEVSSDPATYSDVVDAIEECLPLIKNQSYSAAFAAINSPACKRVIKECINEVMEEREAGKNTAKAENMDKVIRGFGEVIDAIHRQDERIKDHIRSVLYEMENRQQPYDAPSVGHNQSPWWKRMVS